MLRQLSPGFFPLAPLVSFTLGFERLGPLQNFVLSYWLQVRKIPIITAVLLVFGKSL